MRKGEVHHKAASAYNPIVVALARDHKGMRNLAKRLHMPYPRLVNWAKGNHLPDFSSPVIAQRHRATEKKLLALSGKTLVEVFCEPEQADRIDRRLVPLREASEKSYDPASAWDFKIDFMRALATLTKHQRRLIELAAAGHTHDELAVEFQVTRQRIGQQLDAIRQQVRRRFLAGNRNGVARGSSGRV